MSVQTGTCPRCGDANPYTTTVCAGCGGRLPWADALDGVRRQQSGGEQAAQPAPTAQPPAPTAGASRPGAAVPIWNRSFDSNWILMPLLFGVFGFLIFVIYREANLSGSRAGPGSYLEPGAASARRAAEQKQAEHEKNLALDAYLTPQDVVSEQLKTPSIAKFPTFNDPGVTVTKIGPGDTFKISAFVDSENSFGAMLGIK